MRAARAVKAKLTFANVMASLAVFLVLTTGTAYAAATITSAMIVNGTIQQVDIKPNSLGTNVIKDNGVKSVDIRDGEITGTDIAATDSIQSNQVGQLDGDADIVDNSITTFDIATDAVDTDEVLDFGLSNQDVGVLFAEVASDATVDNSSGSVTAAKLGTGLYEVDFARNVSTCTAVATIGPSGASSAAGEVNVADRSGNVEAVFVDTNNSAGTGTDLPFRLVVVC